MQAHPGSHLILYLARVSKICGACTRSRALEVKPKTLCPCIFRARITLDFGRRREREVGKTMASERVLKWIGGKKFLASVNAAVSA